MSKAESINEALRGFTDVMGLSLIIDPVSGKYQLTLELADAGSRSIHLRCADVSSLRLSAFGGGLTQFLQFRCCDVSSQQLDRVALRFSDNENETVLFDCARCEISVVNANFP
jgi:hypothetical protein